MIRVAIETATATGTVALARGDRLLAEVVLGDQRSHAENALPALGRALDRAGVARSEIGEVVVGAGPGSFTGLRVAGSMAKGLVAALEVPLVAYSSLLALAAAARSASPVCALFDARRGEVYGGCWRVTESRLETLLPPAVGPVADIAGAALSAAGSGDAGPPGLVFVGDGARLYRERLVDAVHTRDPAPTFPDDPAHPRASWLLWLASRHRSAGAVDDPRSWEPVYVRGSSARPL